MRILVYNFLHHKNKHGLTLLPKEVQVIYLDTLHNIQIYDDGNTILFITDKILEVNFSKVLYGPHIDFGNVIKYFQNNSNKKIKFNMLSPWLKKLSEKLVKCDAEFITLPYPVDIEKYCPSNIIENKAFIYFKHVDDYKLQLAINLIKDKNIPYQVFRYGSYKDYDYLNYIKSCKFGIWVGSHESQGFALQEALSCNIPLFVLDVKSLKDEFYERDYPWRNREISYDDLEATSASYWNDDCGIICKNLEFNNLQENFNKFLEKLSSFNSRKFILENLSSIQFINNLKTYYDIKC